MRRLAQTKSQILFHRIGSFHPCGAHLSGLQAHCQIVFYFRFCPSRVYPRRTGNDSVSGRYLLPQSHYIPASIPAESGLRFPALVFVGESGNHIAVPIWNHRSDSAGYYSGQKAAFIILLYSLVSGKPGDRIIGDSNRNYI